jgi:hypothetical protein
VAEIKIVIDKTGQTSISVNGVSGQGCQNITRSIESAIGKTTDIELTSEYYQEGQNDSMQAGQG